MNVREAALAAHGAGLCVVPPATDGSKAPRPGGKQQWKKYQQQRPSEQDLAAWYPDDSALGVGLVTGTVSSGLELFEFEGRTVTEGVYAALWRAARGAGLRELVQRVAAGYSERSPTGGVHWLYLCAGEPKGSTKLAQRSATAEELQGAPDHKIQTLIETKGEGGYVVVAPSNGSTHPSGKPWKLLRGGFHSIATISIEEREALHELARNLDQMPHQSATPGRPAQTAGNRPGDRFNRVNTWRDLLTPHGWVELGTDDQGVTSWRRPGKDSGVSATTNALGTDQLKAFSTSTPFSTEGTYDRFGAYAALEFAGDLAAAARSLSKADVGDGKETKPSAATKLLWIAQEKYQFGQTHEGEAFAVDRDGGRLARVLRGDGSIRTELAALYFEKYEQAVSGGALTDAIATIEGFGRREPRQLVGLRVERASDGVIVIDLGDPQMRVVVVRPAGWELVENSPVLFRRTELTGAMPVPERGGDLNELRALLNVSEESWPLLVAWLLCAWVPDIPHPVLWLSGEQGTGKSESTRMVATLVDPSPAAKRSSPRDLEQWTVAASGSWVVPLDNVSGVSEWLSDAICRAVTGDGSVRRQLYTGKNLTVDSFRRVVILNGIDAGALRGDLGQRLVPIELERIPDSHRRSERLLRQQFDQALPRLFGALLDLLAQVLAWQVEHPEPTHGGARMADFAELVAAVDAVRGTDATAAYRDAQGSISAQVVESDPVTAAVVRFAQAKAAKAPWRGNAEELLRQLDRPDQWLRSWPVTGQALAARIRRSLPALRDVGVLIEFRRSKARRSITVELAPPEGDQAADGTKQEALWQQ